jgi:hypothetical protein
MKITVLVLLLLTSAVLCPFALTLGRFRLVRKTLLWCDERFERGVEWCRV